ncbi:metallophosphoesterase family protein [Rubrivirga sp. S365]|uniref:Metallophosphoesterase family protein n=1 Tax=Rubrivirga litoralis TaxID=3075598 RepID=A0ABU3BLK4_9BACT|nr:MULTISPECIES: metallophosphoesterase family protein [unclassified Rubrivirga]MDT0630165.1 metallophosphoesterase family protein [Rubrivirga sp. F394]MDT7855676.1 metallophosphoesterase family protein [Rubrivirga sp. S365]
MDRLYAIGDVHGCARTLDALLAALDADAGGALGPGDTLVFVGDYVDRGPDSPGVIDRLLALEAQEGGAEYVFLRGNHDQMMLDYVDGAGDVELWWANGGRTTLAAYERRGDFAIPSEHVDFLRRTELAVERGGFAFVHAGLDTRKSVAENLADPNPAILLWTRKHLDANLAAWEMPVVCGHTPVTEPLDTPRLIGIDTGAVFPNRPGLGRLTGVSLPERRFLSVETAELAV